MTVLLWVAAVLAAAVVVTGLCLIPVVSRTHHASCPCPSCLSGGVS